MCVPPVFFSEKVKSLPLILNFSGLGILHACVRTLSTAGRKQGSTSHWQRCLVCLETLLLLPFQACQPLSSLIPLPICTREHYGCGCVTSINLLYPIPRTIKQQKRELTVLIFSCLVHKQVSDGCSALCVTGAPCLTHQLLWQQRDREGWREEP